MAKQELEANGYEIIECNFYCRFGEIDIIAKDGEYIVFCEVKYRKDKVTGEPAEAVGYKKQKRISMSAMYYMTKKYNTVDIPFRFDVVSILQDNIEIIKNAFEARM